MNWDEAHLQGDLEDMQQAREEAIVRAALERAADVMGEYHWNRYRTKEQGGELSYPAVFSSHTHQDVQEILMSIASDPAEVAAIIKKAGEDQG